MWKINYTFAVDMSLGNENILVKNETGAAALAYSYHKKPSRFISGRFLFHIGVQMGSSGVAHFHTKKPARI